MNKHLLDNKGCPSKRTSFSFFGTYLPLILFFPFTKTVTPCGFLQPCIMGTRLGSPELI